MQRARHPDDGVLRCSVDRRRGNNWAGRSLMLLTIRRAGRREEVRAMDKPSFEQLIREDRAARESKRWRGSFLEYLELVRQGPGLTKLSHGRLYDMIMRDGTQDILDSEDPRVKRLYKDE